MTPRSGLDRTTLPSETLSDDTGSPEASGLALSSVATCERVNICAHDHARFKKDSAKLVNWWDRSRGTGEELRRWSA